MIKSKSLSEIDKLPLYYWEIISFKELLKVCFCQKKITSDASLLVLFDEMLQIYLLGKELQIFLISS